MIVLKVLRVITFGCGLIASGHSIYWMMAPSNAIESGITDKFLFAMLFLGFMYFGMWIIVDSRVQELLARREGRELLANHVAKGITNGIVVLLCSMVLFIMVVMMDGPMLR